MRVLDLDMDYFMDVFAEHIPSSSRDRLSEQGYGDAVWPEDRVRSFLEDNLGLSSKNKLLGRIVVGHNESLFFWEELIEQGRLTAPFEVIHVDSHADLGLGFPTSSFLQGEFITLSIKERHRIRNYSFIDKIHEIDIGDYLLWGIAYRLISSITYCANPRGKCNDYCWDTLKDFNEVPMCGKPVIQYIQLTYNDSMALPQCNSKEHYKRKYLEGAIRDPEVEFRIIPKIEDVKYNGDFDFVVLAQSPNYTPASADFIMDILREYIIEI